MDDDLLFGLPVHPLADLFPMLPEDELADLADDIRANGLLHPVMLDHAGEMLVDGRNRLRACEIANVEPRFECLAEGIEPADYIASVNLARRHMTVGQRAMALAMIHPDAARLRRQGSGLPGTGKTEQNRLSQARSVLRVAPDDLAPLVLSGARSLDDAFAEVRRREQTAMGEEAQLARLRAEAPDLVELVNESRLTLAGATAEVDERQRLRQHTIDQSYRALAAVATNFAANVDAIIGGLELDEPLRLDRQQADIIRKSIKLLQARGLLK